MATLDDLVQELEAEAPLDARGEFSLDADKAREKMQRFQLAVPEHYVLLVIQAAVLRGATAIQVVTDSDDVIFRFDGDAFTADELAELYASIFADGGERRIRSRQLLAIALNAATAMVPSFIRVRTPQAALEIRPGRPDRLKALEAGGVGTSEIHVRDRLRPGLVTELVRSWRGTIVEAQVIRERCVHGSVPITLDGERLDQGELGRGLLDAYVVPLLGGEGLVGLTPDLVKTARKSVVHLVLAGVSIATHTFDAPDGVVAIASSDAFNTDVSHTDVVRDTSYKDAGLRLSAARDRVVAALVKRALSPDAPRWLTPALRHWMMNSSTTADLQQAIGARPNLAALLSLPIWRTLGKESRSGDEILTKETWPFIHSHEVRKEALGMAQLADVLILSGEEEDYLRQGLGRTLDHAGARVDRVLAREAAIERWRARKHPGGLGATLTLDREAFTREGIQGEVGLLVEGSLRSRLLVVVEGAVLEEISLPGPMPGITAVIQGSIAPTYLCDGAHRGDAFGTALLELLAAIERMIARVAASPSALGGTLLESLKLYIRSVIVDGRAASDYAVDFMVALGFGHKAAVDLVAAHPMIQVAPRWNVDGADESAAHPLARLPIFPVIDQAPRSLAAIAQAKRALRPLFWVSSEVERVDDADVLVLDPMRTAWIVAVLGKGALRDYRPVIARNTHLRAHLRKPVEAVALVDALFVAHHTRGGSEVAWGVPRQRPVDRSKTVVASVRTLMHRRLVAIVDLEVPIPGLCAVANDDDLHARAGFDGLVWAANNRLCGALDEGLVRLVVDAIAEVTRTRDLVRRQRLREFLLEVAAAIYGLPELAAIHRRMIDESGALMAGIELATLIGASGAYSPALFAKTLGFVREQPGHVTASLCAERLGDPGRKPGESARRQIALRIALAELLPTIGEAPIFDAIGGGERSLLQVHAEYARVGVVRYVPAGTQSRGYQGDEGDVLALSTAQIAALRGLIDGEHLIDATSWLHERQALRAFEERPQLTELKLATHERLVAVEITVGKFRGEIGLRRLLPGDPGGSLVRVSLDRRPVTSIELDDLGLPLVAVLDAAELDVDPTFTSLQKRSYKALRSVIRGAADTVIDALIDHFHAVAVRDRPLAIAWLLHVLSERLEGGTPSRRRLLAHPILGGIARLPLFVTSEGEPRSLNDLFLACEGKTPLRYCHLALEGAGDAIVVDEAQKRLLFRFFAHRVDVAEVLAAQAEAARRRAAAPPLADGPPVDALQAKIVDKPALQGAFWIAATGDPRSPLASTIAVGSGGRVVEESRLCEPLLVGGAVRGGRDVTIDPEWRKATIDGNQRRRIRRLAIDLWRGVAGEYRRGLGRLGEPERPEGLLERLGLLRDALWIQLCALRAVEQRLAESIVALCDELTELPLLPLANARLISLRQALREQPPELVDLGLWVPAPEPDSALVDALHAELLIAIRGDQTSPKGQVSKTLSQETPRAKEAPAPVPAFDAAAFAYVRPSDPAGPPHLVHPRVEPEPILIFVEPEPEPIQIVIESEPDPDPGPPPPEPEQILLERVLTELRLLRGGGGEPLTDGHLASLTVSAGAGRRVVVEHRSISFLDIRHPLVALACARGGDDPILISFVASAVYTHLNARYPEIEDLHEEAFHLGHCRLMTQSLA